MCNLYSLTKGQTAIRDWFRALHDRTGNLPLFPGIFPDQMAPIVRRGAERRVRARDGALGHARPPSVRRHAGHEYPQPWKPALATMARASTLTGGLLCELRLDSS